MFPGESVVARFTSSPSAQATILFYNGIFMAIIFGVVLVPFLLLTLFRGPVTPVAALFAFPLVLVIVVVAVGARKIRRTPPSALFLTERRVIVERYGDEASSAAMGLENLGNVEINQKAWAARRAGVAWVYLLPTGTPTGMVGSGRARHAAAGVVWIPAIPAALAQQLRDVVMSRARDVQARLGVPAYAVLGQPANEAGIRTT